MRTPAIVMMGSSGAHVAGCLYRRFSAAAFGESVMTQ